MTAAPSAEARAARPEARKDAPFEPAPDVVVDDATLPAGTVRVTVLDADGLPIPRAPIALETVIVRARADALDVVAKDSAVADEKGVVTFPKVRVAADLRHVVSTPRGDGTFATEPFTLGAKSGKRVVVHAYETVRDLAHALVAMQTLTALFVRADKIEVEVLYRIYNIGRVAWVPENVRVAFPPGVDGFFASDLGMAVRTADITRAGFTITGTVTPGKHELQYHYEVPRDPSGAQRLVLDQPPRVAQARVVLDASGAARLAVAGFPEAKETKVGDGVPALVTDRTVSRADGGVKSLDITFAGDPR